MPRKKLFILIAILASVSLATYWLYMNRQSTDNSYTDKDDINYSEATDVEKQESDKVKERISEEMDQSDNNQNNEKKQVSPAITTWKQDSEGNLKINGYVQGVIETDGTCKYTLTKNGVVVTESRPALQDAQNTTCGQTTISKSKLSSGQWTTTLEYSSSNSQGVSDETTIEIK